MAKKIIAWLLVVVLTAGAAIGGTLAYLTDRDSEANVFTVGDVDITLDEEFQQGSQLLPGADVEKDVQIKNEGPNDAWVWYTYAVPQGLEAGLILTFDNTDQWTAGELIGTKEVDGVTYNVYVSKYNNVVAAGETTDVGLTKVTMDPAVDITPEGDAYLVIEGETTPLNWNINNTENPVIFINAYAIQAEGFTDVDAAYAAFAGQWGNMVDAGTYELEPEADTWDGTADTTWYNDEDTEFTITTAEQLAGFADLVDGDNTFAGKTVKLGRNIDLAATDENGEPVSFDPIGSYRKEAGFNGTFDGQGYTISNMYQHYDALSNSYYYSDLGLGLFGAVEDATIKDLVIDNAVIYGYSSMCGTVSATAYGESTFENITVTNTVIADYQYYAGGIVGWASGNQQYVNCNVDKTTTVGAEWGDFDNSTGGLIGGAGGSAQILVKDSTISCRIDAYNDVTSTYQWYTYRRCGMIIGNTGKTTDNENGTTVAIAPQLTCEDVTVIYGDWANYTYCEFAGTSWPYVRVQSGVSNSAYSNPRYGHPTDANGNVVENDVHVHNDGEDHQIPLVFDQLYGGGQGVYGTPVHEGVTVVYNNK